MSDSSQLAVCISVHNRIRALSRDEVFIFEVVEDQGNCAFRVTDASGRQYEGCNTMEPLFALLAARGDMDSPCKRQDFPDTTLGEYISDVATNLFGFNESTVQRKIDELAQLAPVDAFPRYVALPRRRWRWELAEGDLVAVHGPYENGQLSIFIGRVTHRCNVPWELPTGDVTVQWYDIDDDGAYALTGDDKIQRGAIFHAQFNDLLVNDEVTAETFEQLKRFHF